MLKYIFLVTPFNGAFTLLDSDSDKMSDSDNILYIASVSVSTPDIFPTKKYLQPVV